MGCSIQDIALAAGVSASSVSRVFSGRGYVREDVRKKVFEMANQLHYSPKATVRHEVISILTSGNIGEYEARLLSGFFNVARRSDMKVEVVDLGDREQIYRNFSRAVIGLVYNEAGADFLRTIKNIPTLTINYITPGVHYVCTDHFASGYMATKRLIEQGHQKIAIFVAPYEHCMSWGEGERIKGYQTALDEHSIAFRRELVGYGARIRINQCMEVLSAEKPTAVIACGESLLLPVRYAIELLGKSIPDDISFVGFYAPSLTPFILPAITSLQQDLDMLAEQAILGIEQLLRGEKQRIEVMMPNDWVEGNSIRKIERN